MCDYVPGTDLSQASYVLEMGMSQIRGPLYVPQNYNAYYEPENGALIFGSPPNAVSLIWPTQGKPTLKHKDYTIVCNLDTAPTPQSLTAG